MFKFFKGELYKLNKSNTLLVSIFLIFLYSLTLHLLIYFDDQNFLSIYKNFFDEYFLLYIVLFFYNASNLFSCEYEQKTIIYLQSTKVYFAKVVVLFLYLIFIVFYSFILSYDVTLIFEIAFLRHSFILTFLKEFLGFLPLFLIMELMGFIFSIIYKKSSLSLISMYLFYFLSSYINAFIVRKDKKLFYYFFTMCWNLNNVELGKKYLSFFKVILVLIITINLLLILGVTIYRKQRKC